MSVACNDTHGSAGRSWIGVDLDGTLAHYDGWKGPESIGDPVPRMVDRVVRWIAEGKDVRIMTARVAPGQAGADASRAAIEEWLERHIYPSCPVWFNEPLQIRIPITHEKDYCMVELWDDRCVQVIPNTGLRADGKDQ